MIVTFNARGTGGGSGAADYLLGKERDRPGATVRRGDPEATVALIDQLKFSHRYTSGCLSFAEADMPTSDKEEIMDGFEQAMFPGLDADQYEICWIEHQDKGRLELNFLIANVELSSGKQMTPYYHSADLPRIDAWKCLVNDEHDMADPNDPARTRALVTSRDLPRDTKEAAETITRSLTPLFEVGAITNRTSIIQHLQAAGLTVARETKSSISIADPGGGKNIRLKGKIYERDFEFSENSRAALEARSHEYRENRRHRIEQNRAIYKSAYAEKRERNQQRYKRPRIDNLVLDSPGVSAVGQRAVAVDLRSDMVSNKNDSKQREDAQPTESGFAGPRPSPYTAHSKGQRTVSSDPEKREKAGNVSNTRQRMGNQNRRVNDDDDGIGESLIGRIKKYLRRIREEARLLAEDVRKYISEQYALDRASRELERNIREFESSSQRLRLVPKVKEKRTPPTKSPSPWDRGRGE